MILVKSAFALFKVYETWFIGVETDLGLKERKKESPNLYNHRFLYLLFHKVTIAESLFYRVNINLNKDKKDIQR